jgi:hypothetical protein
MIQTENISKEHYIKAICPQYFIKLPFNKNEKINETKVTCVFMGNSVIGHLECVGIEYFDKIDTEILLSKTFGKCSPIYVSVFKGIPFNIDEQRKRLII